jgi:hypothetical protein
MPIGSTNSSLMVVYDLDRPGISSFPNKHALYRLFMRMLCCPMTPSTEHWR